MVAGKAGQLENKASYYSGPAEAEQPALGSFSLSSIAHSIKVQELECGLPELPVLFF